MQRARLGLSSGHKSVGFHQEGLKNFSSVPTGSLWFKRFHEGCRRRMDQDVRPDRAISMDVMLELLKRIDRDVGTTRGTEQLELIRAGAVFTSLFAGSLRGNEIFMADLKALLELLEVGKEDQTNGPHVILPLLGRFKNEVGERCHLIPLASVTASGLEPRRWLEAVAGMCRMQGRFRGPVFADNDGYAEKQKVYEDILFEYLEKIQLERTDLIEASASVREEFGISRSFRRGSTSHAENQGVSEPDIDTANRWRTVENARGTRPGLVMREHYSDIRLLLPTLLRYSRAL